MKINSNWKDVARKINGFAGVDGLNTGEGLGMKYIGNLKGPQEWGGVAGWEVGNSKIFVNSIDKNISLIELRTDNEQADDKAIQTFEKLRSLLEAPIQVGKPPRVPKGKRLNEWKSIWRVVKGPYRGGGHTNKQLINLFPPARRATISERLLADILKAADFYKWE